MKTLFTINELSAIRFMWAALRRKEIYVLSIEALFPLFGGVLQKIAAWAIKSGRAEDLMTHCPGLHHVRDFSVTVMIYDIFADTEDWQNDYFQFARADAAIADYGRAYKLATCNHMAEKQLQILLLEHAAKAFGQNNIKICGVQSDTLGMYEAYFGRPFQKKKKSQNVLNTFVNFAMGLLFAIYALFWIVARTRPFNAGPEKIFLLADFIGNPKDLDMLEELTSDKSLMIIPRGRNFYDQQVTDRLGKLNTCSAKDGIFGLSGALQAMKCVLVDGLVLYRALGAIPPALFYHVATFPYRRVLQRALFNRYRPAFFWGRDPYNPEHIIRTQELRRVGAQHHGLLHGFGGLTDLYPMFRYITYDRFYIFGSAIYEKIFKDTWASDMQVVPAGSYGVSKKIIKGMNERPQGLKDIVIFTSYLALFKDPTLIAMVRALGAAFTDRKIRVQIKASLRDKSSSKQFIEQCTDGLPNVSYTTDDLFDLIEVSGYAFSDPSTVIMESIQFGLKAFMIDVMAGHKTSLFRNYPHMAVTSPREAVARIRDIESGALRYDHIDMDDLVARPNQPTTDIIRHGMGLPTIAPGAH